MAVSLPPSRLILPPISPKYFISRSLISWEALAPSHHDQTLKNRLKTLRNRKSDLIGAKSSRYPAIPTRVGRSQVGVADSSSYEFSNPDINNQVLARLHLVASKLPISFRAFQFVARVKEEFNATLSKRGYLFPVIWITINLAFFLFPSLSFASDDSIKASGFGFKIASILRKSGWLDEAIVFTLATLPVLELRGAIPVGYWMKLDPIKLTILSVLGNMVPVPFIILYLKKLASFLSQKIPLSKGIIDLLFKKAKEKSDPVREFQWLGLMLFVAVPFPGTGAWTGAIVASILDMNFWPAVSANFFGVVIAGLLVNLIMNLGLKYAIVTGLVLFLVSTVMWSVLRSVKGRLGHDDA